MQIYDAVSKHFNLQYMWTAISKNQSFVSYKCASFSPACRLVLQLSIFFVSAGRAHQECGVPHLLLGRPDWPESEEDL